MGNWVTTMIWGVKEPPPPMVLVPPIFDFPPLAARTRMLVPGYDMLFGKLALRCLFEDYFEQAKHFSTRIMLKPIEDPHVDIVATVSGPLDQKSGKDINGNALFRWQRDLDDPHSFMDLFVSTSEPILRLRSCAYYPKYGFGAFGIFPLLTPRRVHPEDYGAMGLRYGSEKLSLGTTFMPFPLSGETPICAWLVGRLGRLTSGMQYKPPYESKHPMNYKDVEHWSCAIGYGIGSNSPLSPSFNFGLELSRGSQVLCLSYVNKVTDVEDFTVSMITCYYISFGAVFADYIILSACRRPKTGKLRKILPMDNQVNNPFEENQIVGITNYIDFGFELMTSIKGDKSSKSMDDSSFQAAASWQANKNFLIKGKIGPLNSSLALAFKSWWKPSFTFSITAVNDRIHGKSYGFGIRVEDLRQASYQRADPNYVMLTPNKEHLAEGVLRDFGKRPMFQSEIDNGNYDHLPRELKPIGKIF